MSDAWLTGYIDAWSGHYRVTGPEGEVHLARLVALMAHDVEYEDVPSGLVFVGHDGIRDMANAACQMASDMSVEIGSRVSGGGSYAFETVTTGTNTGANGQVPAGGRSFQIRGVSIGSVSEDGLVTRQRDYWDMAGFLRQRGST